MGHGLIDSSGSKSCLTAYEGRLKVAKFNALIYFSKKNKQLHSVSLLQPSSQPLPGRKMLLIFYPFSNKIKKTLYVSGQHQVELWPQRGPKSKALSEK